MTTITLLYFASVRSAIPSNPNSEILSLPTLPTLFPLSNLRELLVSKYEGNEELKLALGKSSWSVNEEMIPREEEDNFILKGGEVICAIPPVSGG